MTFVKSFETKGKRCPQLLAARKVFVLCQQCATMFHSQSLLQIRTTFTGGSAKCHAAVNT